MEIKVSVIVPVYNVEKYVRASVQSILDQSFKDFEVILVNDGSTDSSAQICEDFVKIDSRVKLVHRANGGFGEARNTGLAYATGEYVYFMDSDDLADVNLLADNYPIAVKNHADCLIFGHRKVYSSSRVKNSVDMIPPQPQVGKADIIALLNRGFGFAVWEQLIRRNMIIEKKMVFPAYKREADVAFLLELYKYCDTVIVNPKIYYSYNSFYSSSKFSTDSLHNHKQLYLRLVDLLMQKGSEAQCRDMRAKFFVLWFCHVVPINYVAAPISTRDKISGLKALMNDVAVLDWSNQLDARGRGMLTRISLFVFSCQNAGFMLLFTKAKLAIKRNVKINFKRIFYK